MTKIKNLTREGTRIKSLTLENFGPFQGKHKITFATEIGRASCRERV